MGREFFHVADGKLVPSGNNPSMLPSFNTSNDVEIVLDESMPLSIGKDNDPIGLTKCLEEPQSFHMMTGSTITIPKGIKIKHKDSHHYLITTHEMECTYHP